MLMRDDLKIEDIKRLRLEPGDILILRMRGRITMAAAEHIRNVFQNEIPGHKVMVLEDGARLDVVTPARIETD
jgi:hypothetical protein